MKTLPIKGITAGFVGLLTTATLGIAQQVQAGTVSSSSSLKFRDVTLTLNGTSIVDKFINTIQGQAFATLDGETDAPPGFAQGPIVCPVSQTNTVNSTVTNGMASGMGQATCTVAGVVQASSSANTMLKGFDGRSNSNGLYTFVSAAFDVKTNDVLDLDGFVRADLMAEIKDYIPGPGEFKTASADTTGTYQIIDVDTNAVVFAATPILLSVSIINANGVDIRTLPETDLDALPGGVDYTFTQDRRVRIQFQGRDQASSSVLRTVPEPSALIGLASLGIVALVSRKKNNSIN